MSDAPAGLEGATFIPPDETPTKESAKTTPVRQDFIPYVPWRAWRVLSRASKAGVRGPSGASKMLAVLRGYYPSKLVAEGAAYRAWRT